MPIYSAKGHKEIVNCIDGVGGLGIGEGAPELVTGSRDGESVYAIPIITMLTRAFELTTCLLQREKFNITKLNQLNNVFREVKLSILSIFTAYMALYQLWYHHCFAFMSAGCVKVWDPRQKDEPVAAMEPQEGETKRDCWTVAFGKSLLQAHETL